MKFRAAQDKINDKVTKSESKLDDYAKENILTEESLTALKEIGAVAQSDIATINENYQNNLVTIPGNKGKIEKQAEDAKNALDLAVAKNINRMMMNRKSQNKQQESTDYVVRYAELQCDKCDQGTVLFLFEDYDAEKHHRGENFEQPYMIQTDNIGQGDVTAGMYGIMRNNTTENAWAYSKNAPDENKYGGGEPSQPIGTLLYNIPAFPTCNSTKTAGVSTQEGAVVRNSGGCLPRTAWREWQEVKGTVHTNGEKHLLKNKSYLECEYGGIIRIINSGLFDRNYNLSLLLKDSGLDAEQLSNVKERLHQMEKKGMVITDDFVKMVGKAVKSPNSPTAGVVDAIDRGLNQIGTAYSQPKRGQSQDKLDDGQTIAREYDDCSSFVYDIFGPQNPKTKLELAIKDSNAEEGATYTKAMVAWIHQNMNGSSGIVYNIDTGKGSLDGLMPGDIIYFAAEPKADQSGKLAQACPTVDHVGVYLGGKQVLDAGDSSGMVSIRSIDQIAARDRFPALVIRPETMVGKATKKPDYAKNEYKWN